ncbi:MAG: glycosyl hydrolase, partial [Chloroflexi bacterium 13_1_40CM_4_68_4]
MWKTTDAGLYWENVSDGHFRRSSVGAIAVSASDANVVFAGMGESCIRGNVSHGDGVYRSTDSGKSWQHVGLDDTRHIAKVRVHPSDPDVVYVAALGHAHGPNPQRGVFRSRDGGRTWQKALYRGPKAGASDLSLDPNNPRILYAAFWETVRRPWELVSGGPGSGVFRSTDGGDTWTDLSRRPGLPRGALGKIGIAVSPAKTGRVYAIIEAADGAVFRSDDGGDTWQRLSEEGDLRARAWYYQHIVAHPTNPDTVWVLNVDAWRSIDAGKTFERIAIPHGDHHDLWVDPKDPRRMIEGNDGGATVSLNGGDAWSSIYNQPTAEFYHVATDTRVPYRVYGAQQDNTTITVPSRSAIAGITRSEAYAIGGGESGHIAVRPDDPDIVFAGSYQGFLTRYDHRTGQSRNIMVWPEMSSGWGAADVKHRFQWTFPIALSPHDPNVLFTCGERVFRSTDEGATWEAISPDLTRQDPAKQGRSGGSLTGDNTGAEYFCTVFAFAESPARRGVLWAGSDDGLVHVSRDDGKTWKNVTPRGVPPWSTIRSVEPSPHDAGKAYVAAERYRLDDFRPYFFRSADYGRTWAKITAGIPDDDFARVIREDPEKPGLLYAGTETGLYVSFDDGGRWQRLRGNLPVVPIHDLVVKDGDLVVATHGRSFWILDDVTPLRQGAERVARERVHVFAPRAATRFKTNGGFPSKPKAGKNYRNPGATQVTYRLVERPETGEKVEVLLDAGKNPPDGVIVHYWLRQAAAGELTLAFLDARGREIKTISSERPQIAAPGAPTAELPGEGAEAVSGVT